MNVRFRLQIAEALGSDNRWFCSQAHGREITNEDLLVTHYIKSGGARDFAYRYEEAMGVVNRWYCSQYYRRDIRDPEILWEYYLNHAPTRPPSKNPRPDDEDLPSDQDVAC